MKYYGIAIEKVNRGNVFYMIRKINDNFSNNELRGLTNNIISFFEYYIIIPPKTMQMCAYRTLDEAYSALLYLYNIMENKKLDSDFYKRKGGFEMEDNKVEIQIGNIFMKEVEHVDANNFFNESYNMSNNQIGTCLDCSE